MKQLIMLSLLMTITFLAGPALSADLSSKIKLRVDWSNQYLDLAEQQVSSGRAEFAGKNIKGAREEFKNIIRFSGGADKVTHPTLLKLKQRIESVAAQVKNAQNTPLASPPATTSTAAPAAPTKSTAAAVNKTTAAPKITDPLPSTMIQEMKEYHDGIDWTLQNMDKMSLNDARKYLKSEHPWKTKKQWNKGKFHPQHPDVVSLDSKIEKAEQLAKELVSRGEADKKTLTVIYKLLQQNEKALQAAHEAAKWKLRDISSTITDGNAQKLEKGIEIAREPVARVNTLLPAARAAVLDFKQQFPDREALEKLTDDAYQISQLVKRVDEFPQEWLDLEVGSIVKTALDEAQGNIKTYGMDRLAQIEGSDQAMKEHAVSTAQDHVIVFSSILLDTVDALLPELPVADKPALMEFVKARKTAVDRSVKLRADMVKVEKAIRKVNKDILDSEQRKLAAARFPESGYQGGEWDAAEKVIRVAFEAKIRDKKLLKMDIYRPWEVREEARWINDHWQISTYRYIGANCLAKLSEDKYRVYRMNFRNTKMADGSWSKLEQWSVGHSYEILKENIDK